MTVELVTTSSPEIVEAMERLIPQLSRSAPALTAEQCEAFIAQEGVFLFVFRPEAEAGQSAPILGMLTLATFTIPTGLRAWVEDVVVDGEAVPVEDLRLRYKGVARTFAELADVTDVRWELGTFAEILVRLPGGLAPGEHEITVNQRLRVSYMPVLTENRFTRKVEVGR